MKNRKGMKQLVFSSEITGFGSMALGFLEEEMLILFKDDAPQQFRDLAVLHGNQQMNGQIEKGMHLTIGTETYLVTAVGEKANESIESMGHCCLIFKGKDTVALPVQIMLKGERLPNPEIGDRITVE